jgi:hypothetical protein
MEERGSRQWWASRTPAAGCACPNTPRTMPSQSLSDGRPAAHPSRAADICSAQAPGFRRPPKLPLPWESKTLGRCARAHAASVGTTRLRKRGASRALLSAPHALPRSCLCTASGLASHAALLLVVLSDHLSDADQAPPFPTQKRARRSCPPAVSRGARTRRCRLGLDHPVDRDELRHHDLAAHAFLLFGCGLSLRQSRPPRLVAPCSRREAHLDPREEGPPALPGALVGLDRQWTGLLEVHLGAPVTGLSELDGAEQVLV